MSEAQQSTPAVEQAPEAQATPTETTAQPAEAAPAASRSASAAMRARSSLLWRSAPFFFVRSRLRAFLCLGSGEDGVL